MSQADIQLIDAIRSHNILKAIHAIRDGADINANNNYAICECILHGNEELSKLLRDPKNYIYDPSKEEDQNENEINLNYENLNEDNDIFFFIDSESESDIEIQEETDIDEDYIDNFEIEFSDSENDEESEDEY